MSGGEFRVIIAGGRKFKPSSEHLALVRHMVSKYYDFDNKKPKGKGLELITGMAPGADQIPYLFYQRYGVPVESFPAKWILPDGTRDGGAGKVRNEEMAVYAGSKPKGAAIIFWDGASTGSADMIKRARKHKLKLKVVRYGV